MSFGDFLNSINFTKENLFHENEEMMKKEYNPYLINKSLSYHADTLMFANLMNQHSNLDAKMQYEFYLHQVSKGKQFSKWHKSESSDTVELLASHYKCSRAKAEDYAKILTESDIEQIKKQNNRGSC